MVREATRNKIVKGYIWNHILTIDFPPAVGSTARMSFLFFKVSSIASFWVSDLNVEKPKRFNWFVIASVLDGFDFGSKLELVSMELRVLVVTPLMLFGELVLVLELPPSMSMLSRLSL